MVDETPRGGTTVPEANFSLSRWSRLKRSAATGTDNAPPLPASSDAALVSAVADHEPQHPTATNAPEPELPPLTSISLAEDFTPFMRAKVPQAIRQQALKALFREPHFNVMDGLDTYIDDYTQFEPIPPEVLETLAAWKTIKNPPQQVVTANGYAVDAKSEEGRAVLAERARQAAMAGTQDASAVAESGEFEPPLPTEHAAVAEHSPDMANTGEDDEAPAAGLQHERYGRRVGDFSPTAGTPDDVVAVDAPCVNDNRNEPAR